MAAAALETATKELHQQIGLTTDGSQFLTFNLGEELYGVDILRVQEIKGYTAVTKIPNTPSHIKGVLNLRGTIVPIIELRTKFNMQTIDYTAFTVIIVVVVRDKVMGLVVDEYRQERHSTAAAVRSQGGRELLEWDREIKRQAGGAPGYGSPVAR